jgi:hypothetical protein
VINELHLAHLRLPKAKQRMPQHLAPVHSMQASSEESDLSAKDLYTCTSQEEGKRRSDRLGGGYMLVLVREHEHNRTLITNPTRTGTCHPVHKYM